jgi:xylulokinase
MSLQTTRADLIRSVLEGVALQSRWLLGPVEKFAGTRFDALRILGGGAESDLWCQIHADALGRRVERVREPMAAQSRGAALIAALALGIIGFDDVPALVPVDRAFVPDPQVTPVYDALARELPKVYSGLKGTFSRLRSPR